MDTLVGVGFIGLVVLIIAGLIGAGIYFHQAQQARIATAYKHVAQVYGGQFIEPTWLQNAMVQFPYRNGMGTLDIFTTGGKHKRSYTRLWLPWPDSQLYLNIAPQGFFGMLGEAFGMGDHKLGDPGFDDRYHISCNNPMLLPRVANPHARMRLNNLYDLLGNCEIDWTIESGGLRVMKFGIIDDPQVLHHYVNETIGLYDAALGAPAGGPTGYGNPAMGGGYPAQGGYPAPGGYPAKQDMGPIPFDSDQGMPPIRGR